MAGQVSTAHLPSNMPLKSPLVTILGFDFWNPDYDEFWSWWTQLLDSPERASLLLCLANANTLNMAATNPDHAEAVRRFDVLLNDGIGIRLASQMRKQSIRYNFNGTDLIPRIFSEAHRPIDIFLYGGTESSNANAAEQIERKFPSVRVAGRINGYVDPETEAVPAIAESGAEILLVGMGHPKQELFMTWHRERLGVKVAVAVGGLFDFLSNSKPRAPQWMRATGLEWVFRMSLEPRRLAKRYLIGNPLFLARCLRCLRADLRQGAFLAARGEENS